MTRKKILYLVSELEPFLQRSSLTDISRQLIEKSAAAGNQVRVIMPKFGVISERRNRIHEVQRLCGINIPIDGGNVSLLVKVAPLAKTRVQVYFIDNEDLFCHKGVFHNADGVCYPDNTERVVFICKAAMAILEHLAWKPDIIHCVGWPWFFVPTYTRIAYKNSFFIKEAKIVYTYGGSLPKESFDFAQLKRCMMPKVTDQDLAPLAGKGDLEALVALSKADSARVFSTLGEQDSETLKVFEGFGIPSIPYDDGMVGAYHEVYRELLEG